MYEYCRVLSELDATFIKAKFTRHGVYEVILESNVNWLEHQQVLVLI